jgi:hypothetical protein
MLLTVQMDLANIAVNATSQSPDLGESVNISTMDPHSHCHIITITHRRQKSVNVRVIIHFHLRSKRSVLMVMSIGEVLVEVLLLRVVIRVL